MEVSCNYFIWSYFSIFFSSLSIIFSLLFGFYSYWYHNWELRNQQIFYGFTFISSIILLIESIDPLSKLGLISPLAISLLSNISSWLSLFLMGYFITSLIRIIEYKDLINKKLIFVYLTLGIGLVFTIVASILQVYYPIWHGIKLIVFAISLILLTLGADYYFYKIIKLFDRLNSNEFEDKKRQWYLITYLVIYHLLIFVICTIQIYRGSIAINQRLTELNWDNGLLFLLHIFILLISEFFFLGKFRVELG